MIEAVLGEIVNVQVDAIIFLLKFRVDRFTGNIPKIYRIKFGAALNM
jgi:hypothetical protein